MNNEGILPTADPSTMEFMADHWLVYPHIHQQEHMQLPHIAELFSGVAERKSHKFDNLTSTSYTRWKVRKFLI
jgi:hypothetical protein